jgi:serine/threonine protein kinase/tetratricopeptide (TPR) repeat protein
MTDQHQPDETEDQLPGAPDDLSATRTTNSSVQSGAPAAEAPGTVIGRYKLLEKIGEGGFGSVYLAEQEQPVRRQVALKVIKLGMDTRQVIGRFEAERQALAMMDHPNIAKVLDAGATDTGRPYFVMELVKGVPITHYCNQRNMPLRDRLDLFVQVCAAVQHAHQKGIIHRDIKPSNVLVTHVDDRPLTKVIDFGIAKATEQPLTEATAFTQMGHFVGTPAYMSPEQADPSVTDIDTRSDIYSLGVLLYELLTGVTPFDVTTLRGAALEEIKRIIREDEPARPSTRISKLGEQIDTVARERAAAPRQLSTTLRGDLDWVIMKALEKDRTRRYETANGLAADIGRYLNDEPVSAGPPSGSYRLKKFVRRNRAGVVAASVVAAALVLGVVGTTWGLLWALKEKSLADARADELKTVTEFQQSLLSEIDAQAMGNGILAAQREEIREGMEKEGAVEAQIDQGMASFDDLVGRVNATNLALQVIDEHVLTRALNSIDEDFADQPVTGAALRQSIATTYKSIGLYERALAIQQEVLKTRRSELGEDHPSTLKSMNSTGLLLMSLGEYAEAETAFRDTLERQRRVLGEDHPDTLASIGNVGIALSALGNYAEAELYYREALEGLRRVLGNDGMDTLTTIANIGGVLVSQAKLDEAEPYYREALEGNRRVLGDEHPNTLRSIGNMAGLAYRRSEYAEAEIYYREQMEISRRVLGDDHPATLAVIYNVGAVNGQMGKLAEAEAFYLEALEGERKVLGNDRPSTLVSVSNIGSLLVRMGRFDEAEPFYREPLETSRRLYGNEHPETIYYTREMGHLLCSRGDCEAALPYFREAYEGNRRALGEDHPETFKSLGFVAWAISASGNHAEAKPLLQEALEGSRRASSGDEVASLYMTGRLADVELALGDVAAAESLYREALEGFRTVLGDDHRSTLRAIGSLAMCLVAADAGAEGERMLRDAVDRGRGLLTTSPWSLGELLGQHGSVLTSLGSHAEAEERLLESYDILKTAIRDEHPKTKQTRGYLVDLYESWHVAEPGKGYDAEAAKWN